MNLLDGCCLFRPNDHRDGAPHFIRDFQQITCAIYYLNKILNSSKTLNERKIAILERALDENTKSIRLRVELLTRGAKIWTEEELKKRWEGLVFSNPHLPELWRAFLDIQANQPIKSVLKYYTKCFETLSAISEGSYATAPPPNLEEEMILIFQQMISFLSQGGQTEKGKGSETRFSENCNQSVDALKYPFFRCIVI